MNMNQFRESVLSLFRAVTALMFLLHGMASLFGVFGGSRGTGQALEFGLWPGWWAALIQLVCGVLVLVGLLSRPCATLASGSMAYAYFMSHQPEALLPLNNGGELAAMYCWAFLLIAVLGPGSWSLDSAVRRLRDDDAPAPAHASPRPG
ncbi:putative oxidoreductase [Spinactinospora alkalitolerans]|uniref:Putative oxidoreductase n=1 Tax=Spinactinospora alkalitolerans TaxID=687207 RepID=A0A852TVU3_9ACTN|nr:DoxX family protein [Spinactinospora alkalitolerans]NYE48129.1 putative oxidoreductase [Spinactinospora alkalitolerans]